LIDMRVKRLSILFFAAAALTHAQVSAQRDTTKVPTGVVLSTRYSVLKRPTVAVRPGEGSAELQSVARQISDILNRDLDFSDRFQMLQTPEALAGAGPVNYQQWSSLNVVYLITSEVIIGGSGYQLNVTLHDVPFTTSKQSYTFNIPPAQSPSFRMAVHAVSDEIVRWMTGQPGYAASRIAFTRGNELMIVDSDGENMQRLLAGSGAMYTPAWSPEASRIAYAVRNTRMRVELRERDLASGTDRIISDRSELSYTPAYSPDGKRLAFSFAIGSSNELHEYDMERRCCARRLVGGPRVRSDLSPSYSPDGQQIIFHSDRLGKNHIFVMTVGSDQATTITPFGEQVKFIAPDWSPSGNEVAFHGESRGGTQIMVADPRRPGQAEQITASGDNEDPSWGPDGRHIVFTAVDKGLYVIDRVTLRTRTLVTGRRLQMPDWSSRVMTIAGGAAAGAR
jgi:TolB protein